MFLWFQSHRFVVQLASCPSVFSVIRGLVSKRFLPAKHAVNKSMLCVFHIITHLGAVHLHLNSAMVWGQTCDRDVIGLTPGLGTATQ